MKKQTITTRLFASILSALLFMSLSMTTALADTDGTELKVTDQPDQLVIQLGTAWSGVEFELKTDAGIFPAPVVVDETGMLKMELGGSKTYTLSCLQSAVAVPNPDGSGESDSGDGSSDDAGNGEPEPSNGDGEQRVSTGTLILFFSGLAVAITALILMKCFKNRRNSYTYEEDDDEYYDDE